MQPPQSRYQPSLQSQIASLFGQYGVPVSQHVSGTYEDPRSRLDRLAGELQGGRSWQSLVDSISGIAGGLDPNLRRAETTAAYEFDPQTNELDRSLELLGMQRDRDSSAISGFMNNGQTALADTYSELQRILGENASGLQTQLQGSRDNISNAYGQAANALTTAQSAALADTSGEAAVLGVQGAEVDPHAELRTAVSDMLGFNALGQANADSVMNNMMTGYGAINSQAQNDVGMEQALAQNQLQNSGMNAMGQVLGQYGEQQYGMMGQLNDLAQQRGARVSELVQQFEDQGYERQQAEHLADLAEEMQRGTLDLQRDELDFQQDRWGNEFDLSNRQLDLDRELGLGGLNQQQQQLDLDRLLGIGGLNQQQQQNDLDRLLGLGDLDIRQQQLQQAQDADNPSGEADVQDYLNINGGFVTGGGMPTLRDHFNSIRKSAFTMAAATGMDPFDAYEYIVNVGGGHPGYESYLLQLGEIYWGVAQ